MKLMHVILLQKFCLFERNGSMKNEYMVCGLMDRTSSGGRPNREQQAKGYQLIA
jgi:hypothetical protein